MATTTKTVKKPTKASQPVAAVKIGTRGRFFEGIVIRKFSTRVVLEFERTVFMRKYERFYKKKTRIHAHLPTTIDAQIGDLIQVQETRPLSKLIHFLVTKIVKKAEQEAAA